MPLPHCRSWAMNACCLMRLLGLIQHQHQLHLQKAEIKVNTILAMNRSRFLIREKWYYYIQNKFLHISAIHKLSPQQPLESPRWLTPCRYTYGNKINLNDTNDIIAIKIDCTQI